MIFTKKEKEMELYIISGTACCNAYDGINLLDEYKSTDTILIRIFDWTRYY